MSAVIGRTHVLCAVGSGTDQVWASVRAGMGRIGNSHVMDRHFEPIQMGLVPEGALGTLPPAVDKLPLTSRARRLVRLAAPAFQAVADGLDGAVPIFMGLPQLERDKAPWLSEFPAYLQALTGIAIDSDRSYLVPRGRASALLALERALEFLRANPSATVVVGGVDTYLDLRLLATLDAERRILGPRVMDGFIPGEGAAFFVLRSGRVAASAPGTPAVVTIDGAASALDPGHRYGEAPARGEGLAVAIEALRNRVGDIAPVGVTFAGFNGESVESKLWGVAGIRHRDMFAPGSLMEHPADKFGDVGAAMGAILVALAAKSLATGARPGPALVWAASDHEPTACAVVAVAD